MILKKGYDDILQGSELIEMWKHRCVPCPVLYLPCTRETDKNIRRMIYGPKSLLPKSRRFIVYLQRVKMSRRSIAHHAKMSNDP